MGPLHPVIENMVQNPINLRVMSHRLGEKNEVDILQDALP